MFEKNATLWRTNFFAFLSRVLQENGYQLLFLSARAISQAYHTRQFLFNLKQVMYTEIEILYLTWKTLKSNGSLVYICAGWEGFTRGACCYFP